MSAPELDPAMVEWCGRHFAMIREGGVWAIPRSGMIFRKEGRRLVLTAEGPYMPEMEGTITPEQLREQQAAEFEAVRAHFGAAGIEVVRSGAASEEADG